MPTPPKPKGAAREAGENLPVNVAAPNWACPHCRHEYGRDLDRATACAQAGPAPDVEAGVPVLYLPAGPVLGLTAVGPARAVTDGDVRRHVRDVVVGAKRVTAAELDTALTGRGGLKIVAARRDVDTGPRARLSSYGTLISLMRGTRDRYGYQTVKLPVWADEPYDTSRWRWVTAPDEAQRAALNTVTGGLLDAIGEADTDRLVTEATHLYTPGRPHRGTTPAALLGPMTGLVIAAAHGAPSHIWALRWLAAHRQAVLAWNAQAIKGWAAGTGGPLPLAAAPGIPGSLPNNPGKRRLAVMEPFGWDYRDVRDAVLDQLTTDAPVNPVPGLPAVADTMRNTTKENPDHVR